MPPSAEYRPRKKTVTSYVSEYVDRADLVELLDKEYKFERRGVIIYEYYIHTQNGYHKIEAPRAITEEMNLQLVKHEKEKLKDLWASRQPSSNPLFPSYAATTDT